MDIERVIKNLQKGVDQKAPYLQCLRHPTKLIESLQELRDLVGNKSAKDVIAKRVVSHLIRNYQRSINPELKPSNFISNIILAGEPGTGKTLLATKIAKVISALDYFEHLRPTKYCKKDQILKKEQQVVYKEIVTSYNFWYTFFIIFCSIIMIFGSMLISLMYKIPVKYSIILVLLLFLLILIVSFVLIKNQLEEGEDSNNNSSIDELFSSEKGHRDWSIDDVPVINLKRDDLVGKYVGHTQAKTLKMLKRCKGCVVFIDEAYQLVNNSEQDFGHELLTTINQYMSEKPNDILFIFAGYVHLIEQNLFSAQPGLRSRFSTILNCGDYSHNDLTYIYQQQLINEGRKFDIIEEQKLIDFFISYLSDFSSYGRDTLRLAEYSIQEKDCDIFRGIGDFETISMEHVMKAHKQLLQNRFASKKNKSDDITSSLNSEKIQQLRRMFN